MNPNELNPELHPELDLSVRPATVADLPLLNRLYGEMDGEGPMPETLIADLFDRIAQIPNYIIYLAELEGVAVGTFTLLILPTMMHPGFHRSALLDSVAVLPEWRSQGIGTAMVQSALNLAQGAGCYKLMLSSNVKRDRAHQFYRNIGFEQHGWSFSLTFS